MYTRVYLEYTPIIPRGVPEESTYFQRLGSTPFEIVVLAGASRGESRTHGFIQCGVVIGSPCGVVGTSRPRVSHGAVYLKFTTLRGTGEWVYPLANTYMYPFSYLFYLRATCSQGTPTSFSDIRRKHKSEEVENHRGRQQRS